MHGSVFILGSILWFNLNDCFGFAGCFCLHPIGHSRKLFYVLCVLGYICCYLEKTISIVWSALHGGYHVPFSTTCNSSSRTSSVCVSMRCQHNRNHGCTSRCLHGIEYNLLLLLLRRCSIFVQQRYEVPLSGHTLCRRQLRHSLPGNRHASLDENRRESDPDPTTRFGRGMGTTPANPPPGGRSESDSLNFTRLSR